MKGKKKETDGLLENYKEIGERTNKVAAATKEVHAAVELRRNAELVEKN